MCKCCSLHFTWSDCVERIMPIVPLNGQNQSTALWPVGGGNDSPSGSDQANCSVVTTVGLIWSFLKMATFQHHQKPLKYPPPPLRYGGCGCAIVTKVFTTQLYDLNDVICSCGLGIQPSELLVSPMQQQWPLDVAIKRLLWDGPQFSQDKDRIKSKKSSKCSFQ